MSDLIKLDVVDVDGAIREAEESVAGDSRADFFRKAAVGGAAVMGGGTLLGLLPELAEAKPSRKQDVKILNYALTLEYLENEFYKEALTSANLAEPVLAAAKLVQKHESAHVKFIKNALGRKAVKKPSFDFGTTTANQANFLKTAVVLEDTGVQAYSGQGPRIKQVPIVKAALSILTVEARHASYLRSLNNQTFAPRSFDKPASMRTVLKRAKPFIK